MRVFPFFRRKPAVDELHFSVKSSSGNGVYDLVAYRTKTGVRFACSCPAGEKGTYCCKHRFALLEGDVTALVRGSDKDVFALADMFKGSKVQRLRSEAAALEKEAAAIRQRLTAVKKAIGVAMQG